MAGRGIHRLVRRGIALPPENLPVFRVGAHGDLVISLSRKFEDPAACQDGRRVTLSNGNFPFSGQLLGPGLRFTKGYRTVPVGTSSLRPILGQKTQATGETNNAKQNTGIRSHSPLLA